MNGQLASFRKAPTPEKAKAILQKVRNNRVTDADFCKDIEDEIEQLRMYVAKTEHEKVEQENTQKQGSGEKTKEQVMLELAENYQTVTPKERQEGMSKLKILRQQIIQIIQGNKEGR